MDLQELERRTRTPAFAHLARQARRLGGRVAESTFLARFSASAQRLPAERWDELLDELPVDLVPAQSPAKEPTMTTQETMAAMLGQLPEDLRQAVQAAFSGQPTPAPERWDSTLAAMVRDQLPARSAPTSERATMRAARRRQLLSYSAVGREVLENEAGAATFARSKPETPLESAIRRSTEVSEQLEREKAAGDPHAAQTEKQLDELKRERAAIEHGVWQLGRGNGVSGLTDERRRGLLGQSALGRAILASA